MFYLLQLRTQISDNKSNYRITSLMMRYIFRMQWKVKEFNMTDVKFHTDLTFSPSTLTSMNPYSKKAGFAVAFSQALIRSLWLNQYR